MQTLTVNFNMFGCKWKPNRYHLNFFSIVLLDELASFGDLNRFGLFLAADTLKGSLALSFGVTNDLCFVQKNGFGW